MAGGPLVRVAEALDEAVRPLRDRHYLLLPRKGVAYGRVPKAANSSVKTALLQLEWPRRSLARVGRKVNRDSFWAKQNPDRARLCTAAELSSLGPGVLTFAVVRNPFSRLVSCYRDKVQGRDRLLSALAYTGFRADMSFEEFVLHAAGVDDLFANNHLRSQHDMLSYRGRLLPDHVCRVERLDVDWRKLGRRVRAHTGRRLPPLGMANASASVPMDLRTWYRSREVVRACRRRYARDFELFYPHLDDPRVS